MMKQWTEKEIVQAATTWANFNGFTGEICGKCECRANVLAGGAGWKCDCEHYNLQSNSFRVPHENPSMGPSQTMIQLAYREVDELDNPFSPSAAFMIVGQSVANDIAEGLNTEENQRKGMSESTFHHLQSISNRHFPDEEG